MSAASAPIASRKPNGIGNPPALKLEEFMRLITVSNPVEKMKTEPRKTSNEIR